MADIKNSFSKGLTMLNVKTSTFLEVNKIKTYISTLNTEIDGLKKEIGDLVYQEWDATGDVTVNPVAERLNLIREKLEIIKVQEEEVVRLNESEKQILGAPETPQAQAPSLAVMVCPNCGQTYDAAPKFCRKCGTKMN